MQFNYYIELYFIQPHLHSICIFYMTWIWILETWLTLLSCNAEVFHKWVAALTNPLLKLKATCNRPCYYHIQTDVLCFTCCGIQHGRVHRQTLFRQCLYVAEGCSKNVLCLIHGKLCSLSADNHMLNTFRGTDINMQTKQRLTIQT